MYLSVKNPYSKQKSLKIVKFFNLDIYFPLNKKTSIFFTVHLEEKKFAT